ncbi:hypothetical protein PRIC2_007250 [Phytophthora ramorum]
MKDWSSSLPFASPDISGSQTVTGSNLRKETKREVPNFSDLLDAASCSPDDRNEMWPSDNPSTSETDVDDENEHYDGAEDAAVDGQPNLNNGGKLCHSSGCPNAARSRGLCPSHGGGTRCRAQGCTKHVVSGGLMVAGGSAANLVATSTWPRVVCAEHMEVDGAAKCPIARVALKAEVSATFTVEEDDANNQDVGPAPKKAVFASHTVADIVVKWKAALAVL